MNIVELNRKVEEFVQANALTGEMLGWKQEFAIGKPEEWEAELSKLADEEAVLRIGIVGRVKAGKSSLLNALIFDGNDVLPKAATPMTASLAIMQYGESVKAEVEFFTREDIEQIKQKHDEYVSKEEKLVREKEDELRMRPRSSGSKLTAQEELELRERAKRMAAREMQSSPAYAAYDQYCRIKKSGKSLEDIQQFRCIDADSIEALMNGRLNDFVGSSGTLMPFTKSVTLHLPHPRLKGLQIIDTPGINDPVTSRGERTEELLQHCDVVLMVSPSGQFLSQEDVDLLHRITTREGTQEAYLVASQVDNQLYGSNYRHIGSPIAVLDQIVTDLGGHAKTVLFNLAKQYPEMKRIAERLSSNKVLHSSGVAYSLLQGFHEQQGWDENQAHVWASLKEAYPDVFSEPEAAKSALAYLANIESVHRVIEEVRARKGEILAERRVNFENSKREALQSYMKALDGYIEHQVERIKTGDVQSLKKQEQTLRANQAKMDVEVTDAYGDLIADAELVLGKRLREILDAEIRRFEGAAESAHGTRTEEYQEYIGRAFFILWKEYKTRTRNVSTLNTLPIINTINRIRHDIEGNLEQARIEHEISWKKDVHRKLVGAMRNAMGDDLDVVLLSRVIKSVLAKRPQKQFELNRKPPSELNRRDVLEGSDIKKYIALADEYVSGMRDEVGRDIKDYIREMVGALRSVDIVADLSRGIFADLAKLADEIENKTASLSRYEGMRRSLAQLQGDADG